MVLMLSSFLIVFADRNVRNDRATPAEIASYYQHYVTQMSLQQNFACGTIVTSVTRHHNTQDGGLPYWKVTGLQHRDGEELGGQSHLPTPPKTPGLFYSSSEVF